MWPAIQWDTDRIILIDQRKLPEEEVYVECRDHIQVAEAIEQMVIRGAPAIGVAAAFGVVLGLRKIQNRVGLDEEFGHILKRLERTRPTARNLFWALERMKRVFKEHIELDLTELKKRMLEEALAIEKEDAEANRMIGFWGKEMIKEGQSVLTHCNAGALATAGYGTALGIIRAAQEEGKKIKVYAGETRPFLQGARLTCWELDKENIPVTLITDSMAGYIMKKGMVSVVVTGADRIARNGDTANKIGTYTLAVLAREHGLPFYIAAPLSTIDFSLGDGSAIPVEERDAGEVRQIRGCLIAPSRINVLNPAFDITPAKYISGIITEKGIAKPPFEESLEKLRKVA